MFTDKNVRRLFFQTILMRLLLMLHMWLRVQNILASKRGCGRQNALKLDNFTIGSLTITVIRFCLTFAVGFSLCDLKILVRSNSSSFKKMILQQCNGDNTLML